MEKLNYFQDRQECLDKLTKIVNRWEMDDNDNPTMTIEADDEFMSVIYSTIRLLKNAEVRTESESEKDDEETENISLPNGLKLFFANIIDNYENWPHEWYIVGRTYESALKRCLKEANACFFSYTYDFFEVESEYELAKFVGCHPNAKAGIYNA